MKKDLISTQPVFQTEFRINLLRFKKSGWDKVETSETKSWAQPENQSFKPWGLLFVAKYNRNKVETSMGKFWDQSENSLS